MRDATCSTDVVTEPAAVRAPEHPLRPAVNMMRTRPMRMIVFMFVDD
jgi:hypothetical protein